jgi:hypothetical protein
MLHYRLPHRNREYQYCFGNQKRPHPGTAGRKQLGLHATETKSREYVET